MMNIKTLQSLLLTGLLISISFFVSAQEKLPSNIKWLTNDTSPIFADPNAKKGGTYRSYIMSFPLTLRHVGPDSNGSFAGVVRGLTKSLTDIHPNTEEILPELATHWAYANDNKTMYFKLDKDARWSDGKPVTADDYLYTIEFMRSKNIVAPWYTNYFTEEIEKVVKYDEYTIAVVSKKDLPELHLRLSIGPTPKHFYGDVPRDFVRRFNWKIPPNTGAYEIDKVNKGKSITLKRKKNWWGKDKKYNHGRFNVDKIRYTVIRDANTAFEYFKKNKLDDFQLTLPTFWHQKAKDMSIYNKGYVKKMWFYNDTQQPSYGFWLNQALDLFKDRNVRYAFAHAINMDKLLKEVMRGDYSRLHNHYTGYGEYSNTKIRAREFSIDKVEQLMTASGWKRGSDGIWTKGKMRFSVKINYSGDHHTQRLVVLKEEAKKAGLEMILKQLDGSSSFKLTLEKKHEVSWMGYSTGLRPAFWQHYHSANAFKPQTNNITNTADPDLDKMIDVYRSSLDRKKRIDLSKRIQAKLHEIGGYVPSYKVGYFRVTYWRWWQFPKIPATKHSGGLFSELGAGLFWMDPDIKKETLRAMKKGKTFRPETIIETTFKPE
jgi:microcin C transport system substrate-binding protein